jgi:hypothetical protein
MGQHFPVVMMLMPCVLRWCPYQAVGGRSDALAQMLACRTDGRALELAPAVIAGLA